MKDQLVPAHDLALSDIATGIFPEISVNKEQALDYLRKKELQFESVKKGWSLISYAGNHLGFVKILPGRTNNYYPKELRILNK